MQKKTVDGNTAYVVFRNIPKINGEWHNDQINKYTFTVNISAE